MTNHTRARLDGTLKFRFGYDIDGAEDRPCQYTNAIYRPDYLSFTLVSDSSEASSHPSLDDLAVEEVSLHGKKLKKDGKPGQAGHREHFYGYEIKRGNLPPWMTKIIEDATAEIREGKAG